MSKELTREQVIDLLYYLGASKVVNKEGKSDIQFTCTVHGESNPSAGFNLDKMCFNCFSCHESGGLEWLVMKSLPEDFKSTREVDKFIKERYGVDLSSVDMSQIRELRRYGDTVNTTTYEKYEKKVLPKSFLAPFKSGKETYKYFYDRGFTKETVAKFNIGRDLVNKTVTVPVYYDNENELAGAIGRYIDPNRRKNERYKIYEVNTGTLVFPQDKCKPIDGVLIVVEGLLDAVYMHQLGYTNTFATLTNAISNDQLKWLKKQGATKLIDMTDNDEMGVIATDIINKKVGKLMTVLNSKEHFPEDCKDPQDMTEEEVKDVITKTLTTTRRRLIRRR